MEEENHWTCVSLRCPVVQLWVYPEVPEHALGGIAFGIVVEDKSSAFI